MLKSIGFASLLTAVAPVSQAFTLIENVSITDQTITIPINGYHDPIIIPSVPTFNDQEPGVVSISNVTPSSFDVQFKEWSYLDGIHGEEYVSFLVVEKGRHHLEDGSVWEAGELALSSGSKHQFFSESFAHAPHVFVSGQTQNDPDAYSLRVSSTSQQTFGISLNEQEAGNAHVEESIGYLAVYNKVNSGTTNEGTPFNLTQEAINESGFQKLQGKLLLQEEQSRDSETNHLLEMVSILSMKNNLFAQDNTHYGKDTMSLRLSTSDTFSVVPGETSGQYGNIALIGTNGLTESSYSSSHNYAADSASGAFDGYNSSTKINADAAAKIKRGIWLTTLAQEHWLQVSFNSSAYITAFRVMLYSAASNPGMGVKDVTLQVSNDNVNFVDHESFSLVKSLDQTIELSQPAVGKFVRLKIHNTQGHSYRVIGELEYFGGFVNSGDVVTPPTEPEPSLGTTCASIKQQDTAASSGMYEIDPDGEGGVAPFYAHCEMTVNGGGWTLVAHHKDGLDNIAVNQPLSPSELGVLPSEQWQAIQNNMTTGMMFVDEYGKVSQLNKDKLESANCVALSQTTDLSQPPVPYDIGMIWLQEGSGCSASGLDYSFISLSTKSTSRGDGYMRIGAALYQHNVKFDQWPYSSGAYSGAEQDTLYYYVK
ncbi:hypothetical protein N474_13735 [Pseudoalteromonas luteoviolacea CPMOR-2]|uniref:Fibrinogen C-terminal domain-containing protein n=1 Tax=Pseudoalteromonas luteoviolacea DSM 6061 TaxID=1365250 RepID=A0A161ZSP5_9GAMM|nr:discoidin domain-containing protein [Pseudoalteromonas luteoviolacea]KZN31476.1 hypothetical protein N475_23335 [Pseudoalteromonas luteoviolacea DSM 6061]KZN55957.1 hypothetical protein N474_13735 [Pseudoalteromonas luteoviolacea CPMOR-2]MBE0388140.1 hypothetical protein [Pseudoalteromonas luteoviolacea DSM 6061]